MSARVTVDGAKFRAGREAKGLSLEQAAEYLGLEPHVLSGVEKGHRTFSAKQALSIYSALSKLTARPPGASRPPAPTEPVEAVTP